MEPVVRYMMVCEHARPRRGTRAKIDILGVLHTLTAPVDAFPIRVSFTVFLCMSGGRGRGLGQIVIVHESSEKVVYAGKTHAYEFGSDPMKVYASTVRIPQCTFPGPGMYRVEFVYNEMVLKDCTLLVREST